MDVTSSFLSFFRDRVRGGWTPGQEVPSADGEHQKSGEALEVESGTQIPPHPQERLRPLTG